MDAVISNRLEYVPDGLDKVLVIIEESEPKLVKDKRYMRLLDLLESL